ncbi:hypothetical protein Nstercoris_01485 [Nitrosomonas stercoris]|uniref:diguanylate cyclase n=1 Tax=Nitrosomonas stercoris TaxID=1444684 RepID=A0A4Y1YQT6_9PROT|nr:hypothetical protein Nstercoris_01485 [Nitrosomonas stercoris]
MKPDVYSIKSKLVVFAVISTLLPTIGLGLLSFKQNEALINDSVTRELRVLIDNINRQLNKWSEENMLAIRALSTSNTVIEGLTVLQQPGTDNELTDTKQISSNMVDYLYSVQEKLDEILELTVFDHAGKIIASSSNTPEVHKVPEKWTHALLTSGVIAIPPVWNNHFATATVSITFPVLSYDNQRIGAIAATLDIGTFKSKLMEIKKLAAGEITMLDHKGNVLLSSAPNVDHQTTLSSQQWELMQMDEESVTYEGLAYPQAIGLTYLSEAIPAVILVEQNYYSSIQAAWIKLRDRFIEFVGMLVVIITGVALYMGHSIVTPLKRLIGAARSIVEGNLDIQLPIRHKDEVGQLTDMFNHMTNSLRSQRTEILAANQAMQQQNQLLQKLSITDGLTGLYNRNKLNVILAEQLARLKRHHRLFCLLMIDIDHFKNINDELGHIVGDKILMMVATVLLKSIRTIDYAARYGGDEFMIVLTETDLHAASIIAERIRAEVKATCLTLEAHPLPITLSIGITQSHQTDTTASDLIARADAALYEAKRLGRDQVYCVDDAA